MYAIREIHDKLQEATPAPSFPRKQESISKADVDPRFRGGDHNLLVLRLWAEY